MERWFWKVSVAGLFLLSLLVTSPGVAQEKEPIRIGMESILTGAYAQPGTDFLNGAKLYLEEIGYKMAGRKVEFFSEDEEGNPSVALTKAKRLVEMRKIHIFVGPLLANDGLAVAPYLESKKIPMVCSTCSDDLTQRQRGKYGVRVNYTCSQSAQVMGDYAYRVLGYRKVTIIAPDYAFGWENTGGFQKVFEDSGGKILQKLWYPFNVNDFSPYLGQVSKDADAIFAMLGGKQAMLLLKQHQEYGLRGKVPIIGVMQITDESILPEMGEEALGVITSGMYSAALDRPSTKDFVKKYRERFKKVPSSFSEHPYTAMRWIDVVANALKGDLTDPEKVMKALKSAKFESPRGPFKMDDYGNPIHNTYIRKAEKVGGEMQNTVIYTYPEVSQFWKYKPEDFLKQPVYSRDFPPLKP